MAQGTCLSSIGRRWSLADVLQLVDVLQLTDVLLLLLLGILLLRHMLRRQVQSLHDILTYADVC